MKITNPVFILLMVFSLSANAEVFKCKSSGGEMIYQSSPCASGETPEGELKIKKMTPQQEQDAAAKLNAEQKEEKAYDDATAKTEKQQQTDQMQQEKLDLELRRTKAQEEEADAAQKRMGGPGSPYVTPSNE